MPPLLYPIDAAFFHDRLQPTLARCWIERTFRPGQSLWTDLLPRITRYHASYHGLAEKSLVELAAEGLPFDRATWRALTGEVLLFAAEEMPILQLTPETLYHLLAPTSAPDTPRPDFPAIRQILEGTNDLRFGPAFYRPETVGFNNRSDVARLATYLSQVDPETWRPDALTMHPEEDRPEELAFTRQSWPDLVALYDRAHAQNQVMICEPS